MNVTLTFEGASPSGSKISIGIAVNGGAKRVYVFEIEELRKPVTATDIESFELLLVKAAVAGLTRAQARNKIQPGLTITI